MQRPPTRTMGLPIALLLTAPTVVAGVHDEPAVPGHVLAEGTWVPDTPLSDGSEPASGLQRPFPGMAVPAHNPTTPERVELGRLLFFDPLLSGDDTRSCAHCHHPDRGFSDGRALPEAGRRNVPSLWNAAFEQRLMWDGRAAGLEAQALLPLFGEHEMDEDPGRLVSQLRALPGYVDRFQAAFGPRGAEPDELVDNVARALAAFQRTLISFDAPFDRYAAGDREALTDAQRRGLALFRSGRTWCFECHTAPTFAAAEARVIGAPDPPGLPPDPGRAGVNPLASEGAFRVPTLRNVALSAPYMHGGTFDTLEEVVDFYADGGGRGPGRELPALDRRIGSFELTARERGDLVEFLHALTDISLLPEVPATVPSGLPVIARAGATPTASARGERPARQPARRAAPARSATLPPSPSPPDVVLRPGDSVQDAIDAAEPGDVIALEPGVYREAVSVDFSGVTLRGLQRDGERAWFDGGGELGEAITASADGLVVEGLGIRDYTGNGLVVTGAKDLVLRDLIVADSGTYGLYPVLCDGVLVERCVVSGIADAAIYVGQSKNVLVRGNECYTSVTGIEIENCTDALVVNNSTHHNSAGILVFVLPNLPVKEGLRTRVVANRVIDNNHENFAPPGSTVAKVPPGSGIIVMAADETEITGNEIRDNGSFGIGVFAADLVLAEGSPELDIDPNCDRTRIAGNTFVNNGTAPSAAYSEEGIPGVDLLWDLTGKDNCWDEETKRRFPPLLPACPEQPVEEPAPAEAAAHAPAPLPALPAVSGPVFDPDGGAVTGTLRFAGEEVPAGWRRRPEGEALAPGSAPPTVQISAQGGVENAVVWLASPAAAARARDMEPLGVRVDQVGATFTPHVAVVPTGGAVVFGNSDSVSHNVHPHPRYATEINVWMEAGEESTFEVGDREDRIRVSCGAHTWMQAWIAVVASPHFAVTDAEGRFAIEGVPPGEYEVRLWHESLDPVATAELQLERGAEAVVDGELKRRKRGR